MIREFINKYRDRYWFKYVAILAVLIVLAFAANMYSKYKEKPEAAVSMETVEETAAGNEKKPRQEQNSGKEPEYTIHIGAGHIIMLTGLTIAYGVVVYKKENKKLKEKEDL